MPSGVPVATVALNGARNAGILAAQILGSQDKVLAKKLDKFKVALQKKVESTAKNMDLKGWKASLK
jgi:5-(carboxyamino)imidazole ribonucleotide mutase